MVNILLHWNNAWQKNPMRLDFLFIICEMRGRNECISCSRSSRQESIGAAAAIWAVQYWTENIWHFFYGGNPHTRLSSSFHKWMLGYFLCMHTSICSSLYLLPQERVGAGILQKCLVVTTDTKLSFDQDTTDTHKYSLLGLKKKKKTHVRYLLLRVCL